MAKVDGELVFGAGLIVFLFTPLWAAAFYCGVGLMAFGVAWDKLYGQ